MTNPTIKDMTTKELLAALESCRGHDEINPTVRVGQRAVADGIMAVVNATEDEIRFELSGRPHVPSKKEAKVIRQLKAQTHQSEEWLRAHPKYWQKIMDACYPNRRVVDQQTYTKMVKRYGNDAIKYYKLGD